MPIKRSEFLPNSFCVALNILAALRAVVDAEVKATCRCLHREYVRQIQRDDAHTNLISQDLSSIASALEFYLARNFLAGSLVALQDAKNELRRAQGRAIHACFNAHIEQSRELLVPSNSTATHSRTRSQYALEAQAFVQVVISTVGEQNFIQNVKKVVLVLLLHTKMLCQFLHKLTLLFQMKMD
jgi:hypothetical protein